jgi:hypothetical protein
MCKHIVTRFSVSAFVILVSMFPIRAQDSQELKAEREASVRLKGEHPLVAIAKSKPSALRPELAGVHPRVFMTQAEIDVLKRKTLSQKGLWQTAVSRVRALNVEPPKPPAEERRVQNEVGIGMAEAAFVYKITGEKKYLNAAKKYMDAAVTYDVWGYSYNKPNVDLAAGHLLYGMGWAYDLLYHDLTSAEREKYRDKLIKQARLLYDYFKPKSGKSYAYSQNHTFIPITGLAVAAYALVGETPEAKDWAATSRAIYDRVLVTYSDDGYYYEGMEYWIFSTPWLVHYMDAHLRATGENLYKTIAGLRSAHRYVAHSTLPGGEFNFDFGDIYAGPVTRSRKGDDYDRERIDGHFRTNYNILYNLADRYNDPEAQGVANWLKLKGQVNAEEIWSFIWYNPTIKAVPIERQNTAHYFPDHEVVYWRSGWDDNATAFAFKAGPPEGHGANEKLKLFPDWRLSSGHAHPDAGSFIVWSRGKYLTGDSGYAGVPMTEHHNAVVIGGRGQAREGNGHDAFAEMPYESLDKIRLRDVKVSDKRVSLIADLTTAYESPVGVEKFERRFTFTAPGEFLVEDTIRTERPQVITSYLHSDNSITEGEGGLVFESGTPNLWLEISQSGLYETVIGPNLLTAPGRPGSVDKGEREERGVRLSITTKKAQKENYFKFKFKIIH